MTPLNYNYRDVHGNYGKTQEEYLESWMKVNAKLEKYLGCKVYGFDPDFACIFDGKHTHTFPKRVAMIIIEKFEMQEKELADLREFYLSVQNALVTQTSFHPTPAGNPIQYYDTIKINEALMNCRPNYD